MAKYEYEFDCASSIYLLADKKNVFKYTNYRYLF